MASVPRHYMTQQGIAEVNRIAFEVMADLRKKRKERQDRQEALNRGAHPVFLAFKKRATFEVAREVAALFPGGLK